jgi:hypothetical protein
MPLRLDGVLKIPSAQQVVSKKKNLLDRMPLAGNVPKSYLTNTTKEDTVLEYVEDFRRQFVQVFPERRPLLLCPKNEMGVRKFVCSTVRPSQLPYNAIYDLQDCANFVSDFLTYFPLDEPTMLPEYLPSPSTTIDMRAGDSLDFANLTCSILRGNGYNAYVVSGYAPKWITTQDRSKSLCPLLERTAIPQREVPGPTEEEIQAEEEAAVAAKPEEGKEGEPVLEQRKKYKLKEQPKHQSKYAQQLTRDETEEEEEKTALDLTKA